jgi:hypothetical protein
MMLLSWNSAAVLLSDDFTLANPGEMSFILKDNILLFLQLKGTVSPDF